jgi:hypothetical protein
MKRIGIIALTLVLALGSLGVGYAHWSDQLYVEGTVKGGDFLVGWERIIDCGDNEDTFTPVKEVGEVDCWLELPEEGVHHTPVQTVYQKLGIKVSNAYPDYAAWCKVDMKNAGTIPSHNHRIHVTAQGSGDLVVTQISETHWELSRVCSPLVPLINIMIVLPYQLEPCTAEEFTIDIHFKQGAEQCHTYTFQIELEVIQYNKSDDWNWDL